MPPKIKPCEFMLVADEDKCITGLIMVQNVNDPDSTVAGLLWRADGTKLGLKQGIAFASLRRIPDFLKVGCWSGPFWLALMR